jgi:hypothetical protein
MNIVTRLSLVSVVDTGRAMELARAGARPRVSYAGGDARREMRVACGPLNVIENAVFLAVRSIVRPHGRVLT